MLHLPQQTQSDPSQPSQQHGPHRLHPSRRPAASDGPDPADDDDHTIFLLGSPHRWRQNPSPTSPNLNLAKSGVATAARRREWQQQQGQSALATSPPSTPNSRNLRLHDPASKWHGPPRAIPTASNDPGSCTFAVPRKTESATIPASPTENNPSIHLKGGIPKSIKPIISRIDDPALLIRSSRLQQRHPIRPEPIREGSNKFDLGKIRTSELRQVTDCVPTCINQIQQKPNSVGYGNVSTRRSGLGSRVKHHSSSIPHFKAYQAFKKETDPQRGVAYKESLSQVHLLPGKLEEVK
ncbi:hypothetical protein ACLOJK_034325, partial [Asimina triloba]